MGDRESTRADRRRQSGSEAPNSSQNLIPGTEADDDFCDVGLEAPGEPRAPVGELLTDARQLRAT